MGWGVVGVTAMQWVWQGVFIKDSFALMSFVELYFLRPFLFLISFLIHSSSFSYTLSPPSSDHAPAGAPGQRCSPQEEECV